MNALGRFSGYHTLAPFMDAMDTAASTDALIACFSELVELLNMDRFCLFEISSVGLSWRKQLVIGTFPEAFLDRFWRERRTHDSAFVRHARLCGRPFQVREVLENPKLNRKEREGVNKVIADGMADGVIFPLAGRFNRIALLAITGIAKKLDQTQVRMLVALSQQFYQRACALATHLDEECDLSYHSVLTNRERECLTWVGHGKTDWEIGCILDISKRTVRYHVENAMAKLNTSTRLQAVIVAIRNVEILI